METADLNAHPEFVRIEEQLKKDIQEFLTGWRSWDTSDLDPGATEIKRTDFTPHFKKSDFIPE